MTKIVTLIFLIVLITFTLCFATDECIVRVELTEERLTPFAEMGIDVIEELENSAILLIDCTDIEKISSHSYEILDHNPEEGRYYLVHTLNSETNLSKYGEILWRDSDNYLIKIDEGVLEEMMKQRVMLKRMTLKAIIIKKEVSLPQFRGDSIVQEIVDLVDPDSILTFVQRLQDFKTRYSLTDSCEAAANYIGSKFTEYGCDSVFFQYHTGGHAPNVIGIKRGVVYPESIYIVICGHFDSYSSVDPWNAAPGADDDASGTTSALEAARVTQNYDFEYSIRFCAWSGEEFGLYGSDYYASQANSQGDSIIAALNADMIAYVDIAPEEVEVIAKISNPPCGWLADFFIAAADTYSTLLTRKMMTSYWPWSDHSSFWDNGYPAILNIEDDIPLPNPYYHLPGDTIGAGYNDNSFCTEVIKAMVATVSLLAVPYYDPGVEKEDEHPDFLLMTGLSGLHPNPFHDRLFIKYHLGNKEHNPNGIDLKIYNVAGRLVRQLDKLPVQQKNQVFWDGKDSFGRPVPSGIYFVSFKVGDYTESKKTILVK